MKSTTVLLVDDQPPFLELCTRMLTRPLASDALTFTVRTAPSGEDAIPIVRDDASCAVIVSDLRMAGMDGLTFLEEARRLRPDSVRILLTAAADFRVAVEAINRGVVFRLLTKPPERQTLWMAVADGLRQHQLLIGERELLEQTLMGSVRVLVEILTLLDPVGSSRALRIHRYVRHMARSLGLPDAWQLEVAAMLSHIGALTLAREQDPAVAVGPRAQFAAASALLEQIPRLEGVAGMIAYQQEPVDDAEQQLPLTARDPIRRGGQLVKIATAFDAAILNGASREKALAGLRSQPQQFDGMLVEGLRNADLRGWSLQPRRELLSDLTEGMILDEDLRNEAGMLIMPRGQELTLPVLLRLQAHTAERDRHKRIRVLAPRLTGLTPPADQPFGTP